ncbi:hypothetical protein ACFWZ2_41915 [Streptomyces sp. NPDC059002]|uniref:hypothetical protein n=1 Tax=Streptomyces sp. NPDC059002 TaxID=3346690 RepID=UPI0036B9777D
MSKSLGVGRATVLAAVLISAVAAVPSAVAQSNPQPAGDGPAECGAGYTLERLITLPEGDPSKRVATLHVYESGSKGCVVLHSDMDRPQYLSLKVCNPIGSECDTDSGNSRESAGPVRISSYTCAPVTAKMADTSSSTPYLNYTSEFVFPCDR